MRPSDIINVMSKTAPFGIGITTQHNYTTTAHYNPEQYSKKRIMYRNTIQQSTKIRHIHVVPPEAIRHKK
jgi:hypothetical protein